MSSKSHNVEHCKLLLKVFSIQIIDLVTLTFLESMLYNPYVEYTNFPDNK